MNHQCTACKKALTGGTDTFGWPDEFCWNCYSSFVGEAGDTYYGLAPHHHDETLTGSLIGSTVFDELPKKNANGEYDMGDRIFIPDPMTPGLGLWKMKPLAGWR